MVELRPCICGCGRRIGKATMERHVQRLNRCRQWFNTWVKPHLQDCEDPLYKDASALEYRMNKHGILAKIDRYLLGELGREYGVSCVAGCPFSIMSLSLGSNGHYRRALTVIDTMQPKTTNI